MQLTKIKNNHPSGISVPDYIFSHFDASSALTQDKEAPIFIDLVRNLKSEQCKILDLVNQVSLLQKLIFFFHHSSLRNPTWDSVLLIII